VQDKFPQLAELLDVMAQLRDPASGCPWDLKQTFETVVPSTLEECYELAAAIEDGDFDHIREELGDVLFQVVFYAQLAKEAGQFEFSDVVAALVEKLIRRHPHVFPVDGKQLAAKTEEEIKASWEKLKKQERASRQQHSVLADIPLHMPSLSRSQKLQKRASGVGFDWHDLAGTIKKLHEELAELELATANGDEQQSAEELGDLLFSCVNSARHMGLDAESVLRAANQKFERRFNGVEQLLQKQGLSLEQASLIQMDEAWDVVKSKEIK
jgi:nucleoside triphosphate diphosphatase